MQKLYWLSGAVGGSLFLSSCVTYPYESAFNSCESEANACYRLCEDIPDEGGYIACQAHCDRDIDRCFDSAYSSYYTSYNYYGGYGYASPWYGRYGSWYPDSGYYLSFNYYDRYGYRKKRHHPHRDHNDRDDHDGRPPRYNPPPNNPPTYTPPPSNSPAYNPPGGNNPRPRRPRDFDGDGRPDRAYRRESSPLTVAPDDGAQPQRSVPPDRGAPPPDRPASNEGQQRTPRRVLPPPSSQPADTQPTYSPPASQSGVTPPSDPPASNEGPRRAPSGRRNGEGPDRDRD